MSLISFQGSVTRWPEQCFDSRNGEKCSVKRSGCRSNGTRVATSIPRTQLLDPNTILQYKEAKILGETSDFRTGAGNTQNEPGTPCSARECRMPSSSMVGDVKGTQ